MNINLFLKIIELMKIKLFEIIIINNKKAFEESLRKLEFLFEKL